MSPSGMLCGCREERNAQKVVQYDNFFFVDDMVMGKAFKYYGAGVCGHGSAPSVRKSGWFV